MIYKLFSIFFLIFTDNLFAASFDCTKATSQTEKMICSNNQLSSLDEKISQLYKIVLNKTEISEKVKNEQLIWLKIRNKCESIECLKSSYENQINALNKYLENNKEVKNTLEIDYLVEKFPSFLGNITINDFINISIFYIVWFSVLLITSISLNLRIAITIFITAPIILYFFFPDFIELAIFESSYFLFLDFIILKIIAAFLNIKFPSNNKLDLSRFELNQKQLHDFKIATEGLVIIDDELDSLKALDINKRKDGNFSERSRLGKETNARITELKDAKYALEIKQNEYMNKQKKFSSFRYMNNFINKVVSNSILLSIFCTGLFFFFIPKETMIIGYGILNIILLIINFIILFFIYENKLEKQEKELHDLVYKYYINHPSIENIKIVVNKEV